VTVAARFDIVALYDERGAFVARVRVPVAFGLPEIILWGSRNFVKSLPYGNYREGRIYLVPLEDMRAGETGSQKPGAGGLKR
jgi:hypothetical protein